MDQPQSAPAPSQQPSQTPPTSNNQNSNAPSSNNMVAIFCYLGILIVIPLIIGGQNNPFIKFHVKQGLALIISFVVGWIIVIIPIIGWIIGPLITLFNLIMIIVGIVNVVSNKQNPLPLIGKFGSKFNF